MLDFSLQKDDTDGWEDSIDNDSVAKLKYPIELENILVEIDLEKMPKAEIKNPANKKKVVTKVVDITKRNKKNKGLF